MTSNPIKKITTKKVTKANAAKVAATAVVVVAALAALPLAAAARNPHNEAPVELTKAQTKEIRQATKGFRDVDAALAAGYLPTEECAELPGVGGMGYHYVNPGYLADGAIAPTEPEVLLYGLDDDGELKLLGVEYFAADADQDLATDDDRPNLYGHPFDGPMAGHDPQMPVHYDLHVWLYAKNPSGMLAAWNPRVTCPTVADHAHD